MIYPDILPAIASLLARTMSVVLTEKVTSPLFKVYDFVAMGRYPHTHWSGRLEKKDDGVIMEALTMVHAQARVDPARDLGREDCQICLLADRCPGDCPGIIYYNGNAQLACVMYKTLFAHNIKSTGSSI